MNLPNKLTVLRILLVPFFVASLLIPFPRHYLVSCLIFIIASITDCLDGKLARKRNLVTDFGKFADPLADKILVISAFICFIALGITGPVMVIIVLIREFTVTSIRLVAASQGKVVAANIWGKIKTVSQIIAICAVMFSNYLLELMTMGLIPVSAELQNQFVCGFSVMNEIFLWISTLFAVISGIIYVMDNRHVIKDW